MLTNTPASQLGCGKASINNNPLVLEWDFMCSWQSVM